MIIVTDESCSRFSRAGHPERPTRILNSLEKLHTQQDIPIQWEKPGPVDEPSLLRAHTAEHLARIAQPRDFDADTPWYPDIADYARASVGAALKAMNSARQGKTAFSLMRPPGHHATQNTAMGFCYLNNIAIAVLEALTTGTKRVAVFDFDVHHGNGTEDILLNRDGAAFFSIHQHPCYPGTGTVDRGHNCSNFPMLPFAPREEYRTAFTRALEKLKRFEPELVAVSAGFDAYARDPLAQETLEAEDFHWLGQALHGLGIPLFSLLEGGYSKELPGLITAYLAGLEGK